MNNEFDNKSRPYSIGRPMYPEAIIHKIKDLGIGAQSSIADIGAGTGLLTKMLGQLECDIFAVEPNMEMLNECKNYCSSNPNIHYIHAPAEDTQLKDNSIDFITIAQAFHWFDKQLCKAEFQRILKADGYVLILWNEMLADSDLAKEYTSLLHKYKNYETAGISKDFDPDKEKRSFFGQEFEKVYYENRQTVTEKGFIGNALSLSYTPAESDNNYSVFLKELCSLFNKYEEDGKVTFEYETEACYAKLV
jgi:ubiquinone/menaquinone biosynthesis C-methylase UbiE